MKKLHKFLFKSFIGPFLVTFFIALFILIMQFLWLKIDEIAGKGLEWYVIAELLLYFSASLVTMALPLAVLLSSIMTFGNLGEHFELTAIKASGIPLQKFMRPLTIFIVLLSIGAFFYSNHVIPYANLKAYSLLHDIKKQREELKIREGVFYNDIEDYSIKIKKKNEETKLLKGIMIYKNSDKGNVQTTVADSGYIRMAEDGTKLLITLFSGETYEEVDSEGPKKRKKDKNEYPFRVHRFKEQNMLLDIKGFNFTRTDESLFKDSYQMLNISQLQENIDSLEKKYTQHAVDFSHKVNSNIFVERELNEKERKDSKQQRKIRNKEKPQPKEQSQSSSIDADNSQKDNLSQKGSLSTAKKTKTSQTDNGRKNENIFSPEKFLDTTSTRLRSEIISTALNYARKNNKRISGRRNSFVHKQKKIYKHQIKYHDKFRLAVACIIFFFIGAPLGSIIRKGGLGTPMVISVIMFILYYIISMTGENFAEEGSILPSVGMWISTVVFLPMGIFLTYKATNDSVILNPDTYIKSIKKILQFKFLKKEES
ncbi:MAG: LptF/LptG family permease [Bacteroidota bacterium]